MLKKAEEGIKFYIILWDETNIAVNNNRYEVSAKFLLIFVVK